MALQKSKELPSGISGNYHKIVIRTLDGSKTTINVELYKDEAARDADKSSLLVEYYTFEGLDNPCTIAAMDEADSNPIKLCYEKLKTLPEFDGAVDVLEE